jgi:Tol biopolymer transport system component
VQLPALANFMFGASWSPDGKSIAASRLEAGKQLRWVLNVVQVSDASIKLLYSDAEFLGRPVWLPDGNSLLVPIGLPRENRNQIWEISYPGGERGRFTNDLSNYAPYLDLTRDRSTLVALDQKQISHIWIAPEGKSDLARQITSGGSIDVGVAPGFGNKLLLQSDGDELVSMNSDGSERNVLVPQLRNFVSRTACGDRYLLFDSYDGSNLRLMRSDPDGSNMLKLSDDVLQSQCSHDGKWLIFTSREKLYRLPIDGGAPAEIASAPGGGSIAISADDKLIAFIYQEGSPVPQTKAAVVPAEGGKALHVVTLPTGIVSLRWSPDGKALHYLLTRNGATNVWEQPLSGGNPRQFTHFTSGLIFDFSWSRDGKQLLLSKGDQSSDVVMISKFR